MKLFIAPIFCQLYTWNLKYAPDESWASRRAKYFFGLLVALNFISIYVLTGFFWRLLINLQYLYSIALLISLFLGGMFILFLFIKFPRKKKYEVLCKMNKYTNGLFGLPAKRLARLYVLLSIILFAISLFTMYQVGQERLHLN